MQRTAVVRWTGRTFVVSVQDDADRKAPEALLPRATLGSVTLMVMPDAHGLLHVRTSWPGRMTMCLDPFLVAAGSHVWIGPLENKIAPTCLRCVAYLHRTPRR